MRPLILSVLIALLAVACETGAETTTTLPVDTTTTTEATTTTTVATTTTTAATTTTETPAGELPDTPIAAVDAEGRVVILDGETAEVDRVLMEGVAVDDPAANAIDVDPTFETVYVSVPGVEPLETEIVAVPVDGGEPETVAEGNYPAVSPDGETLAYVDYEPVEGPGQPLPVIVLRGLETGDETRYGPEDGADFVFTSDLTWTQGGISVAFIAGEVQTGAWLLNTTRQDTLAAAERLGPVARQEGARWTDVAGFGERLAVVELCCDLPPDQVLVLSVLLGPFEVEGTLLPSEPQEPITDLEADVAFERLLFISGVAPDTGGTLMTWDGGDQVTEVTDGVVSASW